MTNQKASHEHGDTSERKPWATPILRVGETGEGPGAGLGKSTYPVESAFAVTGIGPPS